MQGSVTIKTASTIFACCLLAIIVSTAAYAVDGPYVRGSIGLAHVNDIDGEDKYNSWTNKLDMGITLGIAAGYCFKNIRLEAETAYQKNDYDKVSSAQKFIDASGDMTNLSFLANVYYDFSNTTAFTPFVSAGIGINRIEVNDLYAQGWPDKVNEQDTVFAYQFSAGVGYTINNTLTLDTQYRYFATEDPNFGDVDYEFSSHNFIIGVRIHF